tara:strand:+ start:1034 stop:1177 length:144 start_codon:yes stop_codon:yes gene_type:complete
VKLLLIALITFLYKKRIFKQSFKNKWWRGKKISNNSKDIKQKRSREE